MLLAPPSCQDLPGPPRGGHTGGIQGWPRYAAPLDPERHAHLQVVVPGEAGSRDPVPRCVRGVVATHRKAPVPMSGRGLSVGWGPRCRDARAAKPEAGRGHQCSRARSLTTWPLFGCAHSRRGSANAVKQFCTLGTIRAGDAMIPRPGGRLDPAHRGKSPGGAPTSPGGDPVPRRDGGPSRVRHRPIGHPGAGRGTGPARDAEARFSRPQALWARPRRPWRAVTLRCCGRRRVRERPFRRQLRGRGENRAHQTAQEARNPARP